jgi:hypothetical protein
MGGLDPSQVWEVRGHADRDLRIADQPTAPGNRRVSITMLFDAPMGPTEGGAGSDSAGSPSAGGAAPLDAPAPSSAPDSGAATPAPAASPSAASPRP